MNQVNFLSDEAQRFWNGLHCYLHDASATGNKNRAVCKTFSVRADNYPALTLEMMKLSKCPPGIGSMAALRTLSMQDNKLTELPEEWKQLINLKRLNVCDNQLADVPQWISLLAKLENLDLEGNRLVSLRLDVIALSNLKVLNLQRNQITVIPPEIGLLKSLQILQLGYNNLTALPDEIGDLRELREFHLCLPDDCLGNKVSVLPATIGKLTKLTLLNIWNNLFTSLPDELGDLESLVQLGVGGNEGLTDLPETLTRITTLTEIGIEVTGITQARVRSILRQCNGKRQKMNDDESK